MKGLEPVAERLAVFALCANVAFAQYVVGARAGSVQFTEGEVKVDGQLLKAAPLVFPLLKNGQTVQTTSGRVEILLGPAVFLRLAENGELRMSNTDLEETRVDLLKGTVLVEVVDSAEPDRIAIRFGETQTEFKKMGLYRFDLDRGTLRVYGGEAEIRSGAQAVRVDRGRMVRLDSSLSASRFNPKEKDDLLGWAARRSFLLFASSREVRQHRTHWETTVSGWSWNRDFQMRLFSPVVAADYRMKQAQDVLEKLESQRTLNRLNMQDQQVQQQQQPGQPPQMPGIR